MFRALAFHWQALACIDIPLTFHFIGMHKHFIDISLTFHWNFIDISLSLAFHCHFIGMHALTLTFPTVEQQRTSKDKCINKDTTRCCRLKRVLQQEDKKYSNVSNKYCIFKFPTSKHPISKLLSLSCCTLAVLQSHNRYPPQPSLSSNHCQPSSLSSSSFTVRFPCLHGLDCCPQQLLVVCFTIRNHFY